MAQPCPGELLGFPAEGDARSGDTGCGPPGTPRFCGSVGQGCSGAFCRCSCCRGAEGAQLGVTHVLKRALNTLLCFLGANIPIFQSFPILGSAGTGERLRGTQCPLQRQHHTKKLTKNPPFPPTAPVPGRFPAAGQSPLPVPCPPVLGSGWRGWLPSPAPALTLDSAPGTARQPAGLLGRRAGLFTVRAAIRSVKGEAKHMVSNVPDPLFHRPSIARPRLLGCSSGGTGSVAVLLAGATVPRGFGVSLLLNPVFSGLHGSGGKASLGTVGASRLDAERPQRG